MPGMDGYETCRELKSRKSTKHIPIIMLTAIKTDAESRVKGLNFGADAFLSKPVDPAELTAQVNVMLRMKKAEDKLRLEKTNLEGLILERTKKLKESEEKFRAITQSAIDAIFIKNLESKYIYVNPAMEKLFDSPAENLIGKTDIQLFGETEGKSIIELDEIVLNGEVVVKEYNKTVNKKVYSFHTIKVPLKNSEGEIIGLCGIARDMTKRRGIEEENRNLIQMVEQSPVVVVLTDLNGNIEYVNPKFTSVTGYSFEEAKGQNPRIMKSGETSSEEYEKLWETITKGDIWHGEFHNKKKNGELYWEDATIGPVKDIHGEITHYLAVKEDITKNKRMTQQLQQAQKLEAIGRFAGGIAHDFNNILQVIIGYVYFAEQDLSENDSRFKNIEEIRKAADKAAALSYQLLAFSSSQVLEPRNININNLIEGLLKMIRRIIGENINLQFDAVKNLDSIHADPSQIEQIIMNLCVNARDAMMNGGDLIIKTENIVIGDEYCQKYSWGKKGKYILLTVTDTGLGMDKATVDKIFEPFFTTKKESNGTGLGLATVFGIVRQHGGMINVFSEEGKGTTFKIYFPIVERKYGLTERKSEYSVQGGNETILIAEDDKAIRNLAMRILEDVGYKVIVAVDGSEAVELFKQNSDEISLVILDMIMPNMGGLSAFKCIEKINPDAKVLFCSGYSSKTFWDDFASMEKAKKIHKPYSRNSLLKIVREILDSK